MMSVVQTLVSTTTQQSTQYMIGYRSGISQKTKNKDFSDMLLRSKQISDFNFSFQVNHYPTGNNSMLIPHRSLQGPTQALTLKAQAFNA